MQRIFHEPAARTVGILAAVLLACAGCGDGGSTGAASAEQTEGSLRAQSLADELAAWICDGAASCCSAEGVAFDRDACLAQRRAAELRRWENDGGRAFSAPMAERCAALIRSTPPTCGNPRALLAKCFRVTDGVVELGGACEYKRQCRGQRAGLVACRNGVCTQKADVGEPCEIPAACNQCVGHAFCIESDDGTPRCQQRIDRPVAGLGERCADDPPGLPTATADGTPAREMIKCEPGLICEPFQGVCIRRQLPGEACDRNWGNILCAEGLCQNGICTRDIQLGEPCDGRGCAEGLYCDDVAGRCAAPVSEGDACGHTATLDVECADGLGCYPDRATGERRCTTEAAYWCERAS